MDLTVIHIADLNTKEKLLYRSYINKRTNYQQKVRDYLENKLPESESEVDWAKSPHDYDFVPSAKDKSYEDLFIERHEKNPYYLNNTTYETFGLEIIVGYERKLSIDFDDWFEKQFDFFCEVFDETNLLSVMVHKETEKDPHVHFYVYSVDSEGKLTTSPCKIGDKVDVAFIERYESYMKEWGYDNEYRKEKAKLIKEEEKEVHNDYLSTMDRYLPTVPRTDKDNHVSYYKTIDADNKKAAALTPEEQEHILDKIIYFFEEIEPDAIRDARTKKMDKETFQLMVKTQLYQMGIEQSEEVNLMVKRVDNLVFGNYIIEPLIDDPKISDIKIYSPNKIRVKRYGERMTTDIHFRDMEDYMRFIEGIAIKNGRKLGRSTAVQGFVDTVSSDKCRLRINISLPFVNSEGFPIVQLRKIPNTKYTMDYLIDAGMMDTKVAAYMLDQVKAAKGILFTGKGGSGKTSLLNTLLDEISYNNSILVIQEGDELFTKKHPDAMFQRVMPPRYDGDTECSLKDLARNGLLVDIDYYIIGEIKGGEAWYFMNAATSGHRCWATCHGSTATEALTRLADYVQYESKYDQEQALKQLANLEIVVFLKDFKVMEISKVTGWDSKEKNLTYENIYRRET